MVPIHIRNITRLTFFNIAHLILVHEQIMHEYNVYKTGATSRLSTNTEITSFYHVVGCSKRKREGLATREYDLRSRAVSG